MIKYKVFHFMVKYQELRIVNLIKIQSIYLLILKILMVLHNLKNDLNIYY